MFMFFGSVLSLGGTSHASSHDDFMTLKAEQKMIKAAHKFSEYFIVDKNGEIVLDADRATLMKSLGVSAEDADLMIAAASELSAIEEPEMEALGFVGMHVNLGPKTRSMGGWAAGIFVGGYIGSYVKYFAVNPAMAGLAAVLVAGTSLAAKNAVDKGLKRISFGHYIPGLSLSKTVTTP